MRNLYIGICTFRRDHVAATLASVRALDVPDDVAVTVVVADNDDTPTARPLVEAQAGLGGALIVYIHAPARNISVARNAILAQARAAKAELLAFLDDDETVQPDWLLALVSRLDATGAAAVLGPVRATYLADAPRWMQNGTLHDTDPVVVADGTIRTGYTCNVLIHLADPSVTGLTFDPALGRSGGEDTAFFHQLTTRGGRIAQALNAPAFEVVPADRANLRWLLRRRYRMGQTHGMVIAQGGSRVKKLWAAALASAKALTCVGLALIRFYRPETAVRNLMRASLHVGVISFLGGLRKVEPYGDDPALKRSVL